MILMGSSQLFSQVQFDLGVTSTSNVYLVAEVHSTMGGNSCSSDLILEQKHYDVPANDAFLYSGMVDNGGNPITNEAQIVGISFHEYDGNQTYYSVYHELKFCPQNLAQNNGQGATFWSPVYNQFFTVTVSVNRGVAPPRIEVNVQ